MEIFLFHRNRQFVIFYFYLFEETERERDVLVVK